MIKNTTRAISNYYANTFLRYIQQEAFLKLDRKLSYTVINLGINSTLMESDKLHENYDASVLFISIFLVYVPRQNKKNSKTSQYQVFLIVLKDVKFKL